MTHNTDGARLLARALYIRRLNPSQAARLLGLDRSTVSRWIKGEALPSRDAIESIHAAFGVSVQSWFRPARATA